MPVNAALLQRIAQGGSVVTPPDPTERYRQLAAARAGMQGEEINAINIQNARQEQDDGAAAREKAAKVLQALEASGGDWTKALPGIKAVDPAFGMSVEKSLLEQRNTQGQIDDRASDNKLEGEKFRETQLVNNAKARQDRLEREAKADAPIEVSPGASLFSPKTNQSIFTAPANKSATRTNYSLDTVLLDGKATDVVRDLDPDSPTSGRVFLQTATGLQDVTGRTSHYEKPPAVSVNAGGLSNPQQTRVQALASQFDSNPVVKQYNEAALRAENVKAILGSKWSGPADMAMIFEFMRALDPTSVVRESEYEVARKTGNWFKGTFAKFNGLFNESGGFLSDQVKKDFNSVLQGKIQAANKQVKGIYDDFGRRIDKITGAGDGAEYLTDYTTMFGGAAPAKGATGGGGTTDAVRARLGLPPKAK